MCIPPNHEHLKASHVENYHPFVANYLADLPKKVFTITKNFFYETIHKAIGVVVLPSQYRSRTSFWMSIEILKKSLLDLGGKEVTFKTDDDDCLEGMYFQGDRCQKSDRTVILFNANGVIYQDYGSKCEELNNEGVLFDIQTWKKNRFNILIFNYRGVKQNSKKMATRNGLVLDGNAALKYIKTEMSVPENKILLHGHSLGGAIASEVAAQHPLVNYCNDRSFSSLSKQVRMMFGNGIIGNIARSLLIYFGWEFNSSQNWVKIKGRKLTIYHQKDAMIRAGARFHEALDSKAVKLNLNMSFDKRFHVVYENNYALLRNNKSFCVGSNFNEDKYREFNPELWLRGKLKKKNSPTVGQLAHMRRYTKVEQVLYFDAINTI